MRCDTSHVTRPVFGVCNQLRLKPACSATDTSWGLEISAIASRGIILSRQWTAKVLIRLRGCAGWSAPLLVAYGINRFSHDMANKSICFLPVHGKMWKETEYWRGLQGRGLRLHTSTFGLKKLQKVSLSQLMRLWFFSSSVDYNNLLWLWGADWKFHHEGNYSVSWGSPSDAEQIPEWQNFQFAPKNHYGFFFLHTRPLTVAFRLEYVLFLSKFALK